jgi:hypothetical protein
MQTFSTYFKCCKLSHIIWVHEKHFFYCLLIIVFYLRQLLWGYPDCDLLPHGRVRSHNPRVKSHKNSGSLLVAVFSRFMGRPSPLSASILFSTIGQMRNVFKPLSRKVFWWAFLNPIFGLARPCCVKGLWFDSLYNFYPRRWVNNFRTFTDR